MYFFSPKAASREERLFNVSVCFLRKPSAKRSTAKQKCSIAYTIRSGQREQSAKRDKKLSYCWETARREGLPKIAEMDMETTT